MREKQNLRLVVVQRAVNRIQDVHWEAGQFLANFRIGDDSTAGQKSLRVTKGFRIYRPRRSDSLTLYSGRGNGENLGQCCLHHS